MNSFRQPPAFNKLISFFNVHTQVPILIQERNLLAQRGLHLTLWQGENAPAVGAAAAALYAL